MGKCFHQLLPILFYQMQQVIRHKPVDTGHKLNVHKTFRRCPGRLLKVLCTFNLRPVSTGKVYQGIRDGSESLHLLILFDKDLTCSGCIHRDHFQVRQLQ